MARIRRGITAAAILAAALALPAPAGAQDVNGDGLSDVAMADYIESIDAPGVTVLFGNRERAVPEQRDQPGPLGFRIVGPDSLGDGEIVGDVNGDGLDDILVAPDDGGWLVFGRRDTSTVRLKFGSTPDAIDLDTRRFARGAGDVNGDGLADIVHILEGRRGAARVLLGARRRPLSRGFAVYTGGRVQRFINPTVAPAGDMNGDGLDDVAVTAPDPNGRRDGFDVEEMLFVVYGKKDRRDVTLTQAGPSSSARVRSGGRPAGRAFFHERSGCWCQTSDLGPAGDVNGDGLGDFGVSWMDPFKDSRSRTDVFFGHRRATTPITLPGRGGATIAGASWVTPFAPLGNGELLVADNAKGILRLTPGRRLRGRVHVRRVGTAFARGATFNPVVPLKDFDGDGRGDLLVGYSAGEDDVFALVFGADRTRPADIRRPNPTVKPMKTG